MKKMRRRTRNRIIGICSTLVVLVLGVFIVSAVNLANDDVQSRLLGEDAYKYGIVTNSLAQWYHVDTNFATKEYSYVNGGFDFRTSQYTDGVDEPVIATKVNDQIKATGANGQAIIYTGEDPKAGPFNNWGKNKFFYDPGAKNFYGGAMDVQQKNANELNSKIDNMISHVRTQSLALAGKLSEKDVDYTIEKRNGQGDAGNCLAYIKILTDDPVVYIDATQLIQENDVYSGFWNNGVDVADTDDILVKRKNKDQTIVFNFARYKNAQKAAQQRYAKKKASKKAKDPAKEEQAPVAEEEQAPADEEQAAPVEENQAPVADDAAPAADEAAAPEAEEEETLSILGVPGVAKAAVKPAEIDVDESNKLALQIHQVRFEGEAKPSDAPSTKEAKEVTINVCESVIYNIPYGKQFWFDEVFGTIAATDSDVKFGGSNGWEMNHATCCGWLVAKTVFTNCGEWHLIKLKKNTPPPTTEPPTTEPPTTEPPTTQPPTTEPPTTEPPTTEPPTTEPPTTEPPTTEPPTTQPPTTQPPTTQPPTTEPPTTEPPTTQPPTTEPPTTQPPTTEPPTTQPPTTQPPATTAPVVTTQPPTNTPPTTYTNPPSNTPPVVYYTFSPSPTETPTTVVEEEVPLSDFTPEEKPKQETTTIVEDVPLAATVPETGETMNPMIPIAGMGLSLLAIVGVAVIRKKKFTK